MMSMYVITALINTQKKGIKNELQTVPSLWI